MVKSVLNAVKEFEKSFLYSTGKLIQVKEMRNELPEECVYVRIGINKIKESREIDNLINILEELKKELYV